MMSNHWKYYAIMRRRALAQVAGAADGANRSSEACVGRCEQPLTDASSLLAVPVGRPAS
jgi:hypothetical protein